MSAKEESQGSLTQKNPVCTIKEMKHASFYGDMSKNSCYWR
jgi:hypothetical protein